LLLPEPVEVLPEAEVLFEEFDEFDDVSLLVVPLLLPLALGEAEASPLALPLALPLGWLMLPLGWLAEPLLELGVELVEPAAPPVVELEPELLGVCAGFVVSVLDGEDDGDCEDGVCVVSVLGVEGVELGLDDCVELELWSGVCALVPLPDVDVLPVVCASIIRLKVNTSATINKAFFMLFSSSSSIDGAFGEAAQRSPSAPSSADCYDASESPGGGRTFNPSNVARLRHKNAILLGCEYL
jgi:hypothetical protein